jgi:hypothetical protein
MVTPFASIVFGVGWQWGDLSSRPFVAELAISEADDPISAWCEVPSPVIGVSGPCKTADQLFPRASFSFGPYVLPDSREGRLELAQASLASG